MSSSTASAEQTLKLASIRRFICNAISVENYIDQDMILIPSPDGNYKSFDVVVITNTKKQADEVKELLGERTDIAVVFI